jgi:predicted kinase
MDVVLVTGLPGSGKTTLARRLSRELRLPLLSKDAIKEAIFDAVSPAGGGVTRAMLNDATDNVLWRQLAACPVGAVVDMWINPTRGDDARVRSELANLQAATVYEIQCQCPGELAAKRYAARPRSAVHRVGDEVEREIRNLAALVTPLGVGRALPVDTSAPVQVQLVVGWLRDVRGA